jgi:hypothetical protein
VRRAKPALFDFLTDRPTGGSAPGLSLGRDQCCVSGANLGLFRTSTRPRAICVPYLGCKIMNAILSPSSPTQLPRDCGTWVPGDKQGFCAGESIS